MIFVLYCLCFIGLIYGAVTDLKQRILSNKLVLSLLPVMLGIAWLQFGQVYIYTALGVLVVGFVLFLVNAVGAGDVKILFVLSLAVEEQMLLVFMFFVSVFGVLLIVLGLVVKQLKIKEKGVPYGVAIAAGYICFVLLNYTIV